MSKFAANAAILGIDVVDGGAERADSVQKALERVKSDIDFVAIHDAARPCIADEWISADFRRRRKIGGRNSGHSRRRNAETRWRTNRSRRRSLAMDCGKPKRRRCFAENCSLKAYAQRGGFAATDDAQLVERIGQKVTIVPGSPINLKITTREDLRLAEHAMKALPKPKLLARPIRLPTTICGGEGRQAAGGWRCKAGDGIAGVPRLVWTR